MRYVKVFLFIVVFFIVMMFFVQNQEFMSQQIPLTFDLIILPEANIKPISVYVLLLICFLIGGLSTLAFLIWDRIQLTTKLALATMKIRTLEKHIEKLTKDTTN